MPFTTTAIHALRRLTGSSTVSDVDAGFAALADDIDPKLTPFTSGAFANRPASTPGSPGKAGRQYYATDARVLYVDLGARWMVVGGYVGQVTWHPRVIQFVPDGFLLANGQAVSRTTYADLWGVIGTMGGGGDGSTTFNVPDLRGRVVVGENNPQGASLAQRILGTKFGEEAHALTYPELPTSLRALQVPGTGAAFAVGADGNSTAGGGTPLNVMQPSIVLTPLIQY